MGSRTNESQTNELQDKWIKVSLGHGKNCPGPICPRIARHTLAATILQRENKTMPMRIVKKKLDKSRDASSKLKQKVMT